MPDELKPCPFCGSDNVRVIGVMRPMGECLSCGAHGTWTIEDHARAVEAWNTRPAEDSLTAQVDRLRRVIVDLTKKHDWENYLMSDLSLIHI